MKKVLFVLAAFFFAAPLFAQDNKQADPKKDAIEFKETTFNFGKIKKGVPVTHDFAFTNVSESPVIIEVATASCGCTTPTWPQAPVAAGKDNKITAGFNAAAPGPFHKTITVKLHGIEKPVILTIVGEVVAE
jgi:hypothetical protein